MATLFDISCLAGTPEFDNVQTVFYQLPETFKKTIVALLSKSPLLLGEHYFITNPVTGTGISPRFSQEVEGGAWTTLARNASAPSPGGSDNVDWLKLNSIDGDWASTVFRGLWRVS